MDAHLPRVAVLLAALCSLGANYPAHQSIAVGPQLSCRSQNFIVSTPTPEFSREVCEAAERYRRDLALEWLGSELPAWESPCPIQVQVGPHLGAGGATSFVFRGGHPYDWTMTIQGSRERILDSVLPHEVTHTIFASHFGRPLPRWADEGACTTVEHVSERSKQQKLLIQFLKTDRGIAFNHMFAMREYPADILPLYSQGFSLARFLIAQGGKQKFVQYVGDGMQWNNWTRATNKHYGYTSLSQLQVTWLDWVRHGSSPQSIASPVNSGPSLLAIASQPQAGDDVNQASETQPVPLPAPRDNRQSHAAGPADLLAQTTPASAAGEGWYQRHRNQAFQNQTLGQGREGEARNAPLSYPRGVQQMSQNGVILDWQRPPQEMSSGSGSTIMR